MKRIILAAPLLLAACGTLPEPFYGNPGAEGARLAAPADPVLVVPTPGAAMLDDASAALYAKDLAAALAGADVPSIARPAGRDDWRLVASAALHDGGVVPHYVVIGSDGKTYGQEDGARASAAAWANGDTAALRQQAATDAMTLARLLARLNAAVQESNPDSLENRAARLFFAGVVGAPGDGDDSLALAMRRDLPGPDEELVDHAGAADFIVDGVVKPQPDGHGQLLVELDWNVSDGNARKVGQVTQLHALKPGDIIPNWGDVAAAAAAEAAAGVKQVIANAVLHRTPQPAS